VPEYYQQKGKYTVCWGGKVGSRVYVAWYQKQAIGYFRAGSDEVKKQAAEACCNEHFNLNNKKAG